LICFDIVGGLAHLASGTDLIVVEEVFLSLTAAVPSQRNTLLRVYFRASVRLDGVRLFVTPLIGPVPSRFGVLNCDPSIAGSLKRRLRLWMLH
jgi:hypothetical protein